MISDLHNCGENSTSVTFDQFLHVLISYIIQALKIITHSTIIKTGKSTHNFIICRSYLNFAGYLTDFIFLFPFFHFFYVLNSFKLQLVFNVLSISTLQNYGFQIK